MTTPDRPSTADLTRATLLLRLRDGGSAREVAWREFFDLYQPIIAAFARRSGADFQETEELVQDVMHAFFRVSPEFQYDPAKGRFRGYLKTCVVQAFQPPRAAQDHEKCPRQRRFHGRRRRRPSSPTSGR